MNDDAMKPEGRYQSGAHPSVLPIYIASVTDVGQVRAANEDSYLVVEPSDPVIATRRGALAVVADGMGGAVGGARASRMVVECIRDTYYANLEVDPATALTEAVHTANTVIHDYGQQHTEFRGMGSTCTALAILGDHALISHVGDTRTYLVRDHRILQLTDDHSKVAQMVRDGDLSPEEAEHHPQKNVILRSLGPKAFVDVDSLPPLDLHDGDRLVLCTDGLTGFVTDPEILTLVDDYSPDDASAKLLRLANERGGADNITVHIVRVGHHEPRRGATPAALPAAAPPTEVHADEPAMSSRPSRVPAAFVGLVVVLAGVVALTLVLTSDEGRFRENDAGGAVGSDIAVMSDGMGVEAAGPAGEGSGVAHIQPAGEPEWMSRVRQDSFGLGIRERATQFMEENTCAPLRVRILELLELSNHEIDGDFDEFARHIGMYQSSLWPNNRRAWDCQPGEGTLEQLFEPRNYEDILEEECPEDWFREWKRAHRAEERDMNEASSTSGDIGLASDMGQQTAAPVETDEVDSGSSSDSGGPRSVLREPLTIP